MSTRCATNGDVGSGGNKATSGGKKGKDGSLVIAFGSQQPTKKPHAKKVKTMHVQFDMVSAILY
jgi:hypothetical protein